jgi:hypothetical protein
MAVTVVPGTPNTSRTLALSGPPDQPGGRPLAHASSWELSIKRGSIAAASLLTMDVAPPSYAVVILIGAIGAAAALALAGPTRLLPAEQTAGKPSLDTGTQGIVGGLTGTSSTAPGAVPLRIGLFHSQGRCWWAEPARGPRSGGPTGNSATMGHRRASPWSLASR